VARARIHVHRRIFLCGRERIGQAPDLIGRNPVVVRAVDHERLRRNLRNAIGENRAAHARFGRRDAAAVERRERRDLRAEFGGREKREPATHTEPDGCVGRVLDGIVRVEVCDGRANVAEKSLVADLHDLFHDGLEIVVAEHVAAIEIRRECGIAERGESLALALHVVVEAERLHVQQHARIGAVAARQREVTA